MAEPPSFLLRSFSQPRGSSTEPNEVNMERALTSSISFGRFMAEPLCWEKWSSFTSSRYLEEAEKYSTPGLVAQKKAYFDEYYKKIAANKAAALVEQQQAANSNNLPKPDTDEMHGDEEVPHTDTSEVSDSNGYRNTTGTVNLGQYQVAAKPVDVSKSPIKVGSSDQSKNIEKKVGGMFIQQQNIPKQPNMVASKQGNLVSALKKRLPFASSMSFKSNAESKLRASVKPNPAQLAEGNNGSQTNEDYANDLVETKRGTSKALHMSIDVGNVKDSKDSLIPLKPPGMESVHSFGNTQPERSHLKPSSSPVQKAQSSAVASSFSFKTEERVSKHREFFQRLERKLTKETEKLYHPAKPKEKAVDDFKKVRQSTEFKAKLAGYCHRGTELQSHHMKVPTPQPLSPVKKPIPTMSQNTDSRPPWRVSGKIGSSKLGPEKSIENPAHPKNPLLRKNKHENASPNIQL